MNCVCITHLWEKTQYSDCEVGAIDAPFFLGNKEEKFSLGV